MVMRTGMAEGKDDRKIGDRRSEETVAVCLAPGNLKSCHRMSVISGTNRVLLLLPEGGLSSIKMSDKKKVAQINSKTEALARIGLTMKCSSIDQKKAAR